MFSCNAIYLSLSPIPKTRKASASEKNWFSNLNISKKVVELNQQHSKRTKLFYYLLKKSVFQLNTIQ